MRFLYSVHYSRVDELMFSVDTLVAAVGMTAGYMEFRLRQILRLNVDFQAGCCCPARHVCMFCGGSGGCGCGLWCLYCDVLHLIIMWAC
jgi:hypothetical protein